MFTSYNTNDPYFYHAANSYHDDIFTNGLLDRLKEQQNHQTKIIDPSTDFDIASSNRKKAMTRKDRHSKIVTAQGPRDRRMRLNLQVASQFFTIQDMLGYDKASKTITWLMKEASSSIEKLKAASKLKGNHQSFSDSNKSDNNDEPISELMECESSFATQQEKEVAKKTKKKFKSTSRRNATPTPLTKASRAMARERARERTKEKKDISNILLNTFIPVLDEESGCHNLVSNNIEERCSLFSANHSNGQIFDQDQLSAGILDYNMEGSYLQPEQWMNGFSNYGDEQMQERMW